MIRLNEVTWYSRLCTIVLFVGIMPALSFYVGTQFQETAESIEAASLVTAESLAAGNSAVSPFSLPIGENKIGSVVIQVFTSSLSPVTEVAPFTYGGVTYRLSQDSSAAIGRRLQYVATSTGQWIDLAGQDSGVGFSSTAGLSIFGYNGSVFVFSNTGSTTQELMRFTDRSLRSEKSLHGKRFSTLLSANGVLYQKIIGNSCTDSPLDCTEYFLLTSAGSARGAVEVTAL